MVWIGAVFDFGISGFGYQVEDQMNQKEADATIHMMVRDEFPSVVFALMSVLPGAKKAIVVDTGSTDGTREWLKKIKDLYPDKIRLVFRDDVPDATGWSFFKYNHPNRKLSEIRNWMVQETTTPFLWVVDGDEVYRDISVRQVVSVFEEWPQGCRVVYVPLLWFVKDINTLGCYDPATYAITGRLFVTKNLTMMGTFPGEVHVGMDGQDLGPHAQCAVRANWIEPFHHFEMVGKPFRRKITGTVKYNGPQPEVFKRIGCSMNRRQDGAQDSNQNPNDGVDQNRVVRQVTGVPA